MKYLFTTKSATEVNIEIDEEDYIATVTELSGSEIGRLEFKLIEDVYQSYLKLTWAFLDNNNKANIHKGIGRECIKLMNEHTGFPICAAQNNGRQNSDGSHLTGDAPGFVAKMEEEGLLHYC